MIPDRIKTWALSLKGLAVTRFAAALVMAFLMQGALAGLPKIEVVAGGWGAADPAEVGKVVAAVAGEFPPAASAIRVRHRFGGPTIDYDRAPDGAIVIRLSARDTRWYQYVYQFAHEYCHVLAHFERKEHGHDVLRENQWFEESLCEAASLYALRRLAAKWNRAEVADPQLREAADQLWQYVSQLLAEPHRRLDAGTDLAGWYARHQETLRHKPYQRELNELVATSLLPLFEADVSRWAALEYLNPATPAPGQSFPDLLGAWSASSPPEWRPLVADIRTLFGIPADGVRTPSNPRPGKGPGSGS